MDARRARDEMRWAESRGGWKSISEFARRVPYSTAYGGMLAYGIDPSSPCSTVHTVGLWGDLRTQCSAHLHLRCDRMVRPIRKASRCSTDHDFRSSEGALKLPTVRRSDR